MFGRKVRPVLLIGTAVLGVIGASSIAAAKTTLTAWICWSSGQSYDDFKTACALYEKKNPNVKIDLKAEPAIGEKLKVASAAGKSPDITFVNGGILENAARYSYFLKPMNAYIKRDRLDDKYVSAAYKLFSWEGTIYALPWSVDPNFAMFYNADAFASVGLPAKAPETPDDVAEFNAKLIQKDGNGKFTRFGVIPWRMYGEHTALINWSFAYGSGQLSDGRKYTMTSPNVLKALDYWMKFADRFGGSIPIDTFGQKAYTDLKRVAMQPMVLPEAESAVKTNKTMKIGIGEMPSSKEGVTPTWLGGQWLGIGIHSKHTNEAWDFIKFATTDLEVAKATRMGRFSGAKEPYNKDIYADEGLKGNLGDKMGPIISYYSKIVPKAQPILQAPIWDVPGMCDIIRKVVINRKIGALEGLTDYQNKMNKRIDEMVKKTVKINVKR